MGQNIHMESEVLYRDLTEAADSVQIDWQRFCRKRILITGATGLIGSLLVKTLLLAGKKHELDLRVVAVVRNQEKAKELFASYMEEGLELAVCDILRPFTVEGAVDFIFHTAGVTASKEFVERPVETILTTLKGTEQVLELARAKKSESVVYLSSMEAYGVVDADHFTVTETDYGYIDPLQVRSSYSESKRMAEGLCGAYAHEYGVPVKTARLAQTFGAGISRSENRVFAQFARSIMSGEDIVLHTDGSKAHCYCYTSDAVLGLLTVLLCGSSGEAYNISNEDTFGTIRGMAQMLVEAYPESGSKLVFDIPEDAQKYGYAPTSKMLVDAGKLHALGWEAHIGLSEMFERLMDYMREWEV